jgi:hypothetical protein
MENKFDLWEVLGKEKQKLKYIKVLLADKSLDLDENTLRLLYATWDSGFYACSNLLFDAIRREFLQLSIRDGSGEVRFLEPVNFGG